MQSLTPFFRFSTSMWNLYTYSYTLDTETPKKCQTNFFRKRKKCAPVQQQQKTRIKKTFSIFIYAISLLCVRAFVRSFVHSLCFAMWMRARVCAWFEWWISSRNKRKSNRYCRHEKDREKEQKRILSLFWEMWSIRIGFCIHNKIKGNGNEKFEYLKMATISYWLKYS